MDALSEYFKILNEKLDQFMVEMDIISESLSQDGASEKKAIEDLVATSENQMRTKSPAYEDIETAEAMKESEVTEYVASRIEQIFGDD